MPYEKLAESSVCIGEIEIKDGKTKVVDQIKEYGEYHPEFQWSPAGDASYIVFIENHSESFKIAGCYGEGILKVDSEFVYFRSGPWFENKKSYDHYEEHLFKPDRMRKAVFKAAILRKDLARFDSLRIHEEYMSSHPSKWPIYVLAVSLALVSMITYSLTKEN